MLCLLSEKAFLYAGDDWLSSSVSQRVARGQFDADDGGGDDGNIPN